MKTGKIVLVVIWGSIVLICFFNRKAISVNGILQYTPENPWFAAGSMLGTIPHTITYPIMGMSVSELSSPQFILAFCAEVIYFVVTAVVCTIYKKVQGKSS